MIVKTFFVKMFPSLPFENLSPVVIGEIFVHLGSGNRRNKGAEPTENGKGMSGEKVVGKGDVASRK